MNENRSQFIGVLLISILVYIIMVRSCKPEVTEQTNDAETNDTTQVSEIDTLTNTIQENEVLIPIVNANGDTTYMKESEFESRQEMGDFYSLLNGNSETVSLENDLLSIQINSHGAQVQKVELKEFKNFSKDPLYLIDESQTINFELPIGNDKTIATKDLFYTIEKNGQSVSFIATTSQGKIEHRYTLTGSESYLLDYELIINNKAVDLSNGVSLNWDYVSHKHEQDLASEKQKSTVYWKINEGDVEHLGIGKSKDESFDTQVDWISCKQRFFNVTLINENGFTRGNLQTTIETKDSTNVGIYDNSLTTNFEEGKASFQWYFGPNDYKLLKSYKNDMHHVVELSYDIFLFRWVKWINAWLIIPLFNFLEQFIPNYGIIILIMTIIIKLLLMPLTFKSYLSTAKTRVLKPELEALKAKFGDDSAGYSRAQMELYQKTGVSMFGGCLPMLLQMPFLLAMFYFFPSSIELRQESFLWAQDLSTFDSIPFLTFPNSYRFIPNHISIFTVLMTISSLLMARFNPQMQSQPTQPGMEMMKYMPYIFPIFLFFIFNSFPAALTYYYFLSNMITFGQQFVINKFFIDEEKIKLQIEENKKKPVKKSKWAAKMEEIYKQQQQMQDSGNK